ncbi:alpha/beta hydrolase [Actinomadura fibrosa]|uniref:Alpha/beta hydrolase n=1 Tax=Actinomadura fibrosa TaxID=111802 RepID=A0ABW2XL32_9ACTN|nr:alpha/beta hydrolase [Actinomadura fibrosa]
MVSFSQLRNAKPSELDAAWRSWRKLVEFLEQAEDTYQGAFLQGVRGARWQGRDAEAAMRTLLPARTRIRVSAGEGAAIASVLNSAQAKITAAQRRLANAISTAEGNYLKVGPDGSIDYPEALPPRYASWQELQQVARNIQAEMAAAVRDATAADAEIAAALHGPQVLDAKNPLARLQQDAGLATRLAGFDPNGIPPKGVKDPKAIAAWWKNLPEEQRHLMMDAYPEKIGWLDGLPSEDRNEANRIRLDARVTELQSKSGDLSAAERHDLERLTKLDNAITTYETKGQDLYLLGLDSTVTEKAELRDGQGSDGRAIVAFGNPDTAVNTAVYVPGTTESLDKFSTSMNRAFNLHEATGIYSKGPVSSIAWLGYDAPDDVVKDAPFGNYADAGGPKLNGFVDGLREAQTGAGNPDGRMTAVGHSYGSTVIGEAARHPGDRLRVDDIVVAGSPGMRVEHASDLGIGAGHVYSQEASGDPVPSAGRPGHGGPSTTGGDGGGVFPGPRLQWPTVPSDGEFGGHRLITDGKGHSDYWNEKQGRVDDYTFGGASMSLDEQARVVARTYADGDQRTHPIDYGQGGPQEHKDRWWQKLF